MFEDSTLTSDQSLLIRSLYQAVTSSPSEDATWPNWNWVVRNMEMSMERAQLAAGSLPQADVGLSGPYSLIWRERPRSAAHIQPGERVGLTMAGLYHQDRLASDGLAQLVAAAAAAEEQLPVHPHALPSGSWSLNDHLADYLPAPRRAGWRRMGVMPVAEMLMREPVPLAADTHKLLLYVVELGARLARFREVEDGRSYLAALDSLTTSRATLNPMMNATDSPKATGPHRNIFLVHGRNEAATTAVSELLRSFDLDVIEWSTAAVEAQRTLGDMPSTLDVVRAGIGLAHGVVVLFTPDDQVRLHPGLSGPQRENVQGQARPNVILELGMAMGMARERTQPVMMGGHRTITDIAGVNFVNLTDSVDRRRDLAVRLTGFGLEVRTDHDRWRTAGKLDESVKITESSARPFDFGPVGQAAGPLKELLAVRGIVKDEIELIRHSAEAQGWIVQNQSRRLFRLRGPRGQEHSLQMDRDPKQTRLELRVFCRKLRVDGLRLPRLLTETVVASNQPS